MKKLKPVVFIQWEYWREWKHRQNTFQQMMLLKALRVTQDPKELKQMIWVRTVADVYRTLDKLALRKEYHKALADKWLTFDKILDWIKTIAEWQFTKDDVKLKAYLAILKSLGMDKYEDTAMGWGSWEDLLLDKAEKGEIEKIDESVVWDYEVIEPEMPESLKKKKAEELADAQRLYWEQKSK